MASVSSTPERLPIGSTGRMAYLVHEVGRGARGSKNLDAAEAEEAASLILSGEATPWQAGALLAALRIKGETGPEIAGFTRALRRVAARNRPAIDGPLLDLGGPYDRSSVAFQASPVVAMVCAAYGVRSLLHGEGPRARPGETGPAELLGALGISTRQGPDRAEMTLAHAGVSYYFTPAFIPTLAGLARYRIGMGIRTAFNSAEKLIDLAAADAQIVGIFHGAYHDVVSGALSELGSSRAVVVQGMNGSDDLSPSRNTLVVHLRDGDREERRITAADAGLARHDADSLKAGGPHEQAEVALALLTGRGPEPIRDLVALNAAVRLELAGRCADLREGAAMACDALGGGAARRVFGQWRDAAPVREESV